MKKKLAIFGIIAAIVATIAYASNIQDMYWVPSMNAIAVSTKGDGTYFMPSSKTVDFTFNGNIKSQGLTTTGIAFRPYYTQWTQVCTAGTTTDFVQNYGAYSDCTGICSYSIGHSARSQGMWAVQFGGYGGSATRMVASASDSFVIQYAAGAAGYGKIQLYNAAIPTGCGVGNATIALSCMFMGPCSAKPLK